MSRPYVKIEGPNLAPDYVNAANAVLPRIIDMDGVIGVTLNGGVSRGYADELSEIDLTVYFEHQAYKQYKTEKAPVPFGIAVLGDCLFDIKPVDYSEEHGEWASVKLWDASYARILYDPDGRISALLADKLRIKPAPEAADGDLFSCWWCFKLAGDIWLRRGDILQGHLIMNEAVTYLLKALFLLNGEYVPHEKWLLHMARTLAWTPPLWEERLAASMLAADQSPAVLKARQAAIAALWSDLDARLCALSGFPAGLSYRQQHICLQIKMMAERGAVALDEFDKLIGLERLNYSPYHQLLCVKDDMVVFDDRALCGMTPDQLYVWQYEIVESLRTERNNRV